MTLSDLSVHTSALAAKFAPSVVALTGRRSRATGFEWKPGLIISADDALPDDGDVTATFPDGSSTTLTMVGRDATTDVALLKHGRTDLPPAALSTTIPSLGAVALAIGRADVGATAALGIVSVSSGPWRSMRGGAIDARIELDLRLRSFGAGGLAVDALGNVFGMVVFGPRRRTIVIPSATVARVAARLETHGRVARGYLGLGLQPVTVDGENGSGAMVVSVDAKGPGAAAGLHQGDVLVHVDGQPVTSVSALVRTLGPDSVGRALKLSLRRAGSPLEVSLTVGERPAT